MPFNEELHTKVQYKLEYDLKEQFPASRTYFLFYYPRHEFPIYMY